MRCRIGVFATVACLAAGGAFAQVRQGQDDRNDSETPDKSIHETRQGQAGAARVNSSLIRYHNGPVISGTVKVYYIWYGNWTNSPAQTILGNLANSIGNSPYFNINTTYYSTPPQTSVSGAVLNGGSVFDNYSHGTSLSDAAIQAIVTAQINSHALPNDPNGVYFVLTSADVNETSGFCSQYCGWHTYGTIAGSTIKYAFVGNPARCLSACAQQSTSPNGDAGADGMASIIAHELEESVTDPLLNAWYDGRGYENADKCAWNFGTTYKAANGSLANVNLGGLNYLIQQNWLNVGNGSCAMHP